MRTAEDASLGFLSEDGFGDGGVGGFVVFYSSVSICQNWGSRVLLCCRDSMVLETWLRGRQTGRRGMARRTRGDAKGRGGTKPKGVAYYRAEPHGTAKAHFLGPSVVERGNVVGTGGWGLRLMSI